MPVSEDEMIVSTTDYFLTENVLNPQATAAEVAAFVRKCKTTGQINYTTNQGGTRSVVVVERQKLSENDANDVRRVLGMDYEVECEEGESEG